LTNRATLVEASRGFVSHSWLSCTGNNKPPSFLCDRPSTLDSLQ